MTDDNTTPPVKLRVFPGEKQDTDLVPEEVLKDANDVKRDRWLSIFIQLSNSDRYTKFVEDNFVIGDKIDHEKQTIETMVLEKPIAVGPALALNQIWQMRQSIRFSGANDPDTLLTDILKVLGQEPPSIILNASDQDIQAAIDAQGDKSKLDA
jgi:hypothetical protein